MQTRRLVFASAYMCVLVYMYRFLCEVCAVTWSCVGVCLYAHRLMLRVPQDAADVVCVCVHVGVCGGIVSFCKLERHVAG